MALGHGKAILLVDDEISQRESMRSVLSDAGYEVRDAADYDQAVAIHRSRGGNIDLLVADVSLPGKNGYELAAALTAAAPGLKVLFISGQAGAEVSRFYGVHPGDLHFLQKPFPGASLLARVRTLLQTGESADSAST